MNQRKGEGSCVNCQWRESCGATVHDAGCEDFTDINLEDQIEELTQEYNRREFISEWWAYQNGYE